MRDEFGVRASHLQLALRGQGGLTGDQWFNPFGSQDILLITSPVLENPGIEPVVAVSKP